MENQLTLEQLKIMESGAIIGHGIADEPSLYEKPVKWVAVRGNGYPDWALYYNHPNIPLELVISNGDKAFTPNAIRKLVPCTDEAFKMYRF